MMNPLTCQRIILKFVFPFQALGQKSYQENTGFIVCHNARTTKTVSIFIVFYLHASREHLRTKSNPVLGLYTS